MVGMASATIILFMKILTVIFFFKRKIILCFNIWDTKIMLKMERREENEMENHCVRSEPHPRLSLSDSFICSRRDEPKSEQRWTSIVQREEKLSIVLIFYYNRHLQIRV